MESTLDRLGRSETRARLATAVAMLDRVLHDLKQPLNLIRVVAQDVTLDVRKGRLDPDTIPQSMDEIVHAVDQLAGSIDRLRAFARPGPRPRVEARLSVAAACRAAVERLRAEVPGVVIDERIDDDLPAVRGEPVDLEQAVWELLDNAVRAAQQSKPGAPRVELSATRRDRDVVVAVTDAGGGVPEELRGRLFDPFVSTRPEAGGLGLALVAALVHDLGGQVVLTDVAGGVRVEIRLPGGE